MVYVLNAYIAAEKVKTNYPLDKLIIVMMWDVKSSDEEN